MHSQQKETKEKSQFLPQQDQVVLIFQLFHLSERPVVQIEAPAIEVEEQFQKCFGLHQELHM